MVGKMSDNNFANLTPHDVHVYYRGERGTIAKVLQSGIIAKIDGESIYFIDSNGNKVDYKIDRSKCNIVSGSCIKAIDERDLGSVFVSPEKCSQKWIWLHG